MLIFVQVCRTIDKKLSVFISRIRSGKTNESNEIYKKGACVTRIDFEEDNIRRH